MEGLELLPKSDADTSLETGDPFLKKCDVALTHRKASGKNEVDLRTSDINLTLSPGISNMLNSLLSRISYFAARRDPSPREEPPGVPAGGRELAGGGEPGPPPRHAGRARGPAGPPGGGGGQVSPGRR